MICKHPQFFSGIPVVRIITFLVAFQACYIITISVTSPAIQLPVNDLGSDEGLTVVVPTYKERDNLAPLIIEIQKRVQQYFALFEHVRYKALHIDCAGIIPALEVLFVDDSSPDGSAEELEKLHTTHGDKAFTVNYIIRSPKEGKGLGSAVALGFRRSMYSNLMVMDADLQHPPSVVPKFFQALKNPDVDVVLGTRYGEGGSVPAEWGVIRKIISKGASLLSFPFTSVSDPMTGLVGLRKSVWNQVEPSINTIGFKLALEIFAKVDIPDGHRIVEIAYKFQTRTIGESKLKWKTMFQYLVQLVSLSFCVYPFIMSLLAASFVTAASWIVSAIFSKLDLKNRRKPKEFGALL